MTEHNKQKTAIKVNELDPNFKYEVAKYPGAEDIKRCFACGTCSASCPVREIDERFNPRKIIRMILLGMKDRVLQSDFIWLCPTCYTCYQRCPQGVKFTEIMKALENMAVKEGYIHPLYKDQVKFLEENGVIYPVDNRRRERSSLPLLPVGNKYCSEIFKLTGLSDITNNGEDK